MKFDYSLKQKTIEFDKTHFNLSEVRYDVFCQNISFGDIYILIDDSRIITILNTSIIDYLFQLKSIVNSITHPLGDGFVSHEMIAVSKHDYYSNSITFMYRKNKLQLLETNDHEYFFEFDYYKFKTKFDEFFNTFIKELFEIYPDLKNNIQVMEVYNRIK